MKSYSLTPFVKIKKSLPRSGGKGIPKNPDVTVDPVTGDVFPKTPDGSIGDCIGNIFDAHTKEYSASLRIFTAEAYTDFISDALHVRPSAVYPKGTSLGGRSSEGPIRDESLWIYESPLACCESLENHILAVIKPLTEGSGMDRIRNRITALEVFCMLSSKTAKELSVLAQR